MNPSELLSSNLKRLRSSTSRLNRLQDITAAGGGSNGTLGRIQKGDTGVSIDALAPLAKVFGVEPWQLLAENLGEAQIENQLLVQEQRANYAVKVDIMPINDAIKSLAFHLRNLDHLSKQRASVLLGELAFDPDGYESISTLLRRVIDTSNSDADSGFEATERPRNRS